MALRTVRVVPFQVRRAGRGVTDAGEVVTGTAESVTGWSRTAKALGGWRAGSAATTLMTTWETYLSRLGEKTSGYGQRLVRVADAYEKCDAEAADALGVALPDGGPTDVRIRPGRASR